MRPTLFADEQPYQSISHRRVKHFGKAARARVEPSGTNHETAPVRFAEIAGDESRYIGVEMRDAVLPMCSSHLSPHLPRSEEHTSELQSLMRISYAVFCLNKNKKHLSQQNISILNYHNHKILSY